MITHTMKKQMTAAYHLSMIRLTLNCCLFFETLEEGEKLPGETDAFCSELFRCLKMELEGQAILPSLHKLREQVMGETVLLLNIIDQFSIYKRVLEKLKGNYKPIPKSSYCDKDLAEIVCNYIISNGVLSVKRLKRILPCLPARLTKQRYFDYLAEGLSNYEGEPLNELEETLLKLEKWADPLYGQEAAKTRTDLYEELKRCGEMDYQNMAPESYEKAMEAIMARDDALRKEMFFICSIQELINDLYVIALVKDEVTDYGKEEAVCRSLLSSLLQSASMDDSFCDDAFSNRLSQLEGSQEAYWEDFQRQAIPPQAPERMRDKDYVKALNVDRLHSGSLFADLEAVLEEDEPLIQEETVLVDRAYLRKRTEEVVEAFREKFAGTPRIVMRTLMMETLSELPCFLYTYDQIHDFILGSLETCFDEAEKAACQEALLKELDLEGEAGFDEPPFNGNAWIDDEDEL